MSPLNSIPLINYHPNVSRVSSHDNTIFHLISNHHSFHMLSLIPTHSSTIHDSCQTCISYSIIYVSIITQSFPIKTDHTGTSKSPIHNTASPSISPRLRGLAQASLPSLRLEHQKQGWGHHGISLKRDPSRLGEWPARSKGERVAWARFRAEISLFHLA